MAEEDTGVVELISVRSGLCTSAQLGGFITSLPSDMRLNDTSIYTTPLKFSEGSFPTTPTPTPEEPISAPEEGEEESGDILEEESGDILEEEGSILDDMRTRSYQRRQWDIIESITNGVKDASASSSDDNEASGDRQDEGESPGGGAVYEVPQYTGPVHYKVPRTGYYCVGTFHIYSIFSFHWR